VIYPEFFDKVTIYFSDIVGFTNIAADCKPEEVSNDLYIKFLTELFIDFYLEF